MRARPARPGADTYYRSMIPRLLALLALTAISALCGCARMAALSVTQVAPELEYPLVRVILGDEFDSVTVSSARTYRVAAVRAPGDTVTFFSIAPMVIRRGQAGLMLVDRGWHILESDLAHLSVDIERMYDNLASEWLDYVQHLKSSYPFLFSLILRTHPFQESPSAVVK